MSGRFVGVGITANAARDTLPLAAAHARQLGEVLRSTSDYDADTVFCDDFDFDAVVGAVRSREPTAVDRLVVYWAGHGEGGGNLGDLRLLLSRHTDAVPRTRSATDLLRACAESGAGQLLVILDTCHSGAILKDVAAIAEDLKQYRTDGTGWIGVLVAAGRHEQAKAGELTARILALLNRETGQDDPLWQRAIAEHNENITGNDLCQAVLRNHDGTWSKPDLLTVGSEWWLLPNPHHRADAPAQVVEHLLRAARGSEPGSVDNWFTGRVAEVNRVVAWARSAIPGIHVVTGSAGTGKSAVVGRVVSMSVPDERDRLGAPDTWEHDDVGRGRITAHVHARGLTAQRMARQLMAQLPATVAPHGAELSDDPLTVDLVGALRGLHDKGVVPCIVVDGLDEAHVNVFGIVLDLLLPMSQYATVIVSTREVAAPTPGERTVLALLSSSADRLDLDSPPSVAAGTHARRMYVVRRLTGIWDRQDPTAVADHLDARTERVPSFLVARLVTARLRTDPVDTGRPGWTERVRTTVSDLFHAELADAVVPDHRDFDHPDGHLVLARAIFQALSWGFGAGLPEREWRAVATAVLENTGPAPDVEPVSGQDITWFLESFGRYVIRDGTGGQAVFRTVHGEVASVAGAQPHHRAETAVGVLDALIEEYETLLGHGVDLRSPSYLFQHLWHHAVTARQDGLDRLVEFSGSHDGFDEDVALAADALSEIFRRSGRLRQSLECSVVAVGRYELLADLLPDSFASRLAGALRNRYRVLSLLGRGDEALAAITTAVDIRTGLAARDSRYRPSLAMSLADRARALTDLGRHQEALAAATASVEAHLALRADYADGSRHGLAQARTQLSRCLVHTGRPDEALGQSTRAVDDLRLVIRPRDPLPEKGFVEAAGHRPVGTDTASPDLADALGQRAEVLLALDRPGPALVDIDEALVLQRDLAAPNPYRFRHELAQFAMIRAGCLAHLGRRVEEVAALDEAATVHGELATSDFPLFLPRLVPELQRLAALSAHEIVHRVLADFTGEQRVTILLRLADTGELSVAQRATWLALADQSAVDEPTRTTIRRAAQRIRAADPTAFDEGWAAVDRRGARCPRVASGPSRRRCPDTGSRRPP